MMLDGVDGKDRAVISYLIGAFSNNDYADPEPYFEIFHDSIDISSFIQVYVSQNKDVFKWMVLPDPSFVWRVKITDGKISIYDPNKDLDGYDYMVKIIENQ